MKLDKPYTREKSFALFEKAKTYFPGGVNSPVRAFKSVGGTPVFMAQGKGSQLTDEDGQTYIDFCCSWGPLILGHAHPKVRKAIHVTVDKGSTFGTPTRLENELAALILGNNPFIEKLRFVSSGTEAVMSALRLARGATGRNKILKFDGCYHGHLDALLVNAGSGLVTFGESSSAGIPDAVAKQTIVLPLNDPEALERTLAAEGHDIAAIIIEPIPANNGLLLQDKSFLQCLRLKCYKYGILLIFDEVISGFRVGFQGAAGLYGIRPDIITYGKIIGGGLPVGAFGASAKIMANISPEGAVYQAGTLSGNPVAMSAGIATLTECLAPGFYEKLEQKTSKFTKTLQQHAKKKGYDIRFPHIGSIFWIKFGREAIKRADQIDATRMSQFSTMHALLLARGVYIGPSGYEVGFVSSAHGSADLKIAATVFCEVMDLVFA